MHKRNNFVPSQNKLNQNDEELAGTETRETEYLFEFPYLKRDTTIFHLPAEFHIENLPPPMELKNNLAEYKSEIIYNQANNTVCLYTHLILKYNIIQPASYNELATFFQSLNRHQNQKMILRSWNELNNLF